jgi:DNA modification methylase
VKGRARRPRPVFAGGEQGLITRLRTKSRSRRESARELAIASDEWGGRRNDLAPPLALVDVPIEKLRPLGRAVRCQDPAHVRSVASSIQALGFCVPVLIDREFGVVDGLVQLEAAKLLGMAVVPCVRIDHLSQVELRTLRLAINRLQEKGQWDVAELKIEFQELIVLDAPIEIAGFEPTEIDQVLIGEELSGLEMGPLEPNEGGVAIARVGDVFRLGNHRLICGDSTDPAVLARLIGEAPPARLILTDEPYNVPIQGHVSGKGHREFAMASGEMSGDEFLAFNVSWMQACLPHLCEGGLFGTFIDWRGVPTVHGAATGCGLTWLNLITWVKTNAGMGNLYRSQHELLPLFKKGDAPHVNNVQLGRRGRSRSNVWTYPGASSLGSDARRGLQDHPTVKPVALLEDAILDVTNRGDLVIDPFLGSGSTLIAAEKAGRVCCGVELDPLYVDVIVVRFQAATGHWAVLEETGEAFLELTRRRREEAEEALGM